MLTKWSLIFFCAIVYFLCEVDAKICERTEAVTKMVEVSFSTSYPITYHGQCYYACIKTRWSVSVGRRYVPKREVKTIKYCCTGYMRTDDSSNDSDIACEPICMSCKNGHCTAPAQCTCDTGFIPDPEDTHNCLPLCEKGCDHGKCVAPETCRCDFGYTLVNSTCEPVCTEPCNYGICLAPETCTCLPGYRKSENNLCEPYCSNGCNNGFCFAPETCHCNSGWRIKEGKGDPNDHCEPICSKSCGAHGICVAPETCACKDGYIKSESGNCEPLCSPPCGNGTCTAPNTCSCHNGYHIDTDNLNNNSSPLCISTYISSKSDRDVYDGYKELIYDEYYESYSYPVVDETIIKVKSKTTQSDDGKTEPDNMDTDKLRYYVPNTTDVIYTEPMNNTFDETTYSYDTNTVTGSKKNTNISSIDDTLKPTSMKSMSWFQEHWVSIFIPVLFIVTAAIIMLLVWRWAPIIIYFKGRSYVVEGDPHHENTGSRPFEEIQISAINEKEKTTQK